MVEHDNVIGDYAHISAGANLGGTVTIGKSTWVDMGAVVKNNIKITDNVIVSAGTVVINDISESSIYTGALASKIDMIEQSELLKRWGGYYG